MTGVSSRPRTTAISGDPSVMGKSAQEKADEFVSNANGDKHEANDNLVLESDPRDK